MHNATDELHVTMELTELVFDSILIMDRDHRRRGSVSRLLIFQLSTNFVTLQ